MDIAERKQLHNELENRGTLSESLEIPKWDTTWLNSLNQTWEDFADLVSKSVMGVLLKDNPLRWQKILKFNPDELWRFMVKPKLLPLPQNSQIKKWLFEKKVNDAEPFGHLIHTAAVARAYAEICPKKFLSQEEVELFILTCFLHDLPEALVGDRLSGTKVKDEVAFEAQVYSNSMKNSLKEQLIREGYSEDLISIFLNLVDKSACLILADSKYDVLFDSHYPYFKEQHFPSFPTSLYLNPPASLTVSPESCPTLPSNHQRLSELHQLYETVHAMTFVNAVLTLPNGKEDPRVMNLQLEVFSKPTVQNAFEADPYYSKYLEIPGVRELVEPLLKKAAMQ